MARADLEALPTGELVDQIDHARYENGLVDELGVSAGRRRMRKDIRPTIDISRYLVGVPVRPPNFTFIFDNPVASGVPVFFLYTVPAGKTSFLTSLDVDGRVDVVTGASVTFVHIVDPATTNIRGIIFRHSRLSDLAGVVFHFSPPVKAQLREGDQLRFGCTVTGGGIITINMGLQIYEYAGNVDKL